MSEEIYDRLELKKLVEEQYGEFFKKFGAFKAIVDKITGAVNIIEFGEAVAGQTAKKAYELGLMDKEKDLTEKHLREREEFKKRIADMLLTLGKDIEKIKRLL